MAWKRSGVQFPLAPPRNPRSGQCALDSVRTRQRRPAHGSRTCCADSCAATGRETGATAMVQTDRAPAALSCASMPEIVQSTIRPKPSLWMAARCGNTRVMRSASSAARSPTAAWSAWMGTDAGAKARNHGVAPGGCCDPANCLGDAPILGETRGGEDARQVRRVRHGLVYFQRRSACAAHL